MALHRHCSNTWNMPCSFASRLCLMLLLLQMNCIHLSRGAENEETRRVEMFETEITDILVNKVLRGFVGLDYLEKRYIELDLQTLSHNATAIVESKVSTLQEIIQNREQLVRRIAAGAETLRQAVPPDSITNSEVTFYHEGGTVPTNSSEESQESSDSSGKLYYRNAKCGCGHQLPADISDTYCIKSQEGVGVNRQFGKIGVSYEMSSVHIPTEVYNQGPEVLKDIYLSDGMSEVLKKEVCKVDQFSHLTRWSYFTTHRGVMRFFPDRLWSDDCEKPDIYDSRISSWYIQSVSSPKEVVVLIDNSGSVEGLTLNLFIRSVRHLLDTLGTNDFVNIVLFNEEAKYVNDSCTGMLQATPKNKQILLGWMENINTANQSSFEEGFNLALKVLNGSSDPESTHAKCNSLIMLFTDGGATYPTNALNKWNPSGDKRVFTFAVGKNFYEKETTKDIACGNRGDFRSIPSYTATKSEVQGYLVKISEPLASRRDKSVKWTLPYWDELGLGLVITASMPVNEPEVEGKVRSVGVAGIDLVVDDLKNVVVDPEMGPDYFPFVVDNNGFAVFHPNVKENSHDNIVTVDFMDLEDASIEEVRRNIVAGNSGSESFKKAAIFDGRYSDISEYTYSYSPLKDTVFNFGIGIHSSKLEYYDMVSALNKNFSGATLNNVKEQTSDTMTLLYSPPCEKRKQVSYNPCEPESVENATEVPAYEDGISLEQFSSVECEASPQLYSSLLVHALMTADLAAGPWENDSLNSGNDGILALYAALESPSFVRVKLLNSSEQNLIDDNDVIGKEIKQILAHPREKTYLRRAIHRPDWVIYSYVKASTLPVKADSFPPVTPETHHTTAHSMPVTEEPLSAMATESYGVENAARGYILSSKVVKMSDSSGISPLVTGLVFHPETFQRKLFNLDYKCSGNSSCDIIEQAALCNEPEKMSCLLLDDGGYLVSSNQDHHSRHMDKFFGLVDGELMRSLVKHRVFRESHVYDHQAICEISSTDSSAGNPRYFIPTISDLISFGWWFSSASKVFLTSIIHTFTMHLWSLCNVGSAHVNAPSGFEAPTPREQCITRSTIYGVGRNSFLLYGTFGTEACERSFTSVHVVGTNLVLVLHANTECSSNVPLSNKPIDVTFEETCPNKTARFRKRPDENCFDTRKMPESMDSDCSSGARLLPPQITAYFYIAFFIYFHVSA